MNRKLRGKLLLLLTAIIWGSAFVAQRAGMDHIGPYAFNAIRMLVGGIALIPVILFFESKKKKEPVPVPLTEAQQKQERKILLWGGLSCGLVLCFASTLQQIGLVYTSAGKTGFITALYIVLVPVLSLFLGKKIRKLIWLCVLIAALGLYLLCITEDLTIAKGDIFVILCAFGYALHIMVIDYFSPKTDGVKLSCIQFFVCSAIAFIPSFIVESTRLADIQNAWFSILYAGVMSCSVGFTLQIIGQKETSPTVTSLILSLESVFAVLTGFLVLQEVLSLREAAGCVLMFAATVVAQLPEKSGQNKIQKPSQQEEQI